MKVFLSWSGDTSREIAEIFKGWLPKVLQSIDTFMSEEDILLGTKGLSVIGSHLNETNIGILFITKDNFNAPWLNFEAGALSKSLAETNVIPMLFDLKIEDIKGPIGQFQGARNFEKESIRKLVNHLNRILIDVKSLDNKLLNETFEIWHPQLERKLDQIKRNQNSSNSKQDKVENKDVSQQLDDIYSLILRQNRQNKREESNYNSIKYRNSHKFKEELLRMKELLERALAEYHLNSKDQLELDNHIFYVYETIELITKTLITV